jgi:hypothetical protein
MKRKLLELSFTIHNDLIVLLPTIYSFYDVKKRDFEIGFGFLNFNLFINIKPRQ